MGWNALGVWSSRVWIHAVKTRIGFVSDSYVISFFLSVIRSYIFIHFQDADSSIHFEFHGSIQFIQGGNNSTFVFPFRQHFHQLLSTLNPRRWFPISISFSIFKSINYSLFFSHQWNRVRWIFLSNRRSKVCLINHSRKSFHFTDNLPFSLSRLISAPLNPNYSHSEVLFYLQDTSSKLLLLPQGALSKSPPPPTVSAAREAKVPLAEVVFNPKTKRLDLIKEGDNKRCGSGQVRKPEDQDVALGESQLSAFRFSDTWCHW